MSIWAKLIGESVGEAANKIGDGAIKIRSALTGELPPEARKELEVGLQKLEEGQTELNKKEAESGSLFIAGWRPAIGWIGAFGVFYHFIGYSLIEWGISIAGIAVQVPTLHTEGLLSLVTAMLGIAGLRTYEKFKGVSNKH